MDNQCHVNKSHEFGTQTNIKAHFLSPVLAKCHLNPSFPQRTLNLSATNKQQTLQWAELSCFRNIIQYTATVTHRHSYLGSFSLDLEDIRNLNIGAIWKFSKGIWLLYFSNRTWATKGLSYGLGALGPEGFEPKYHSIKFQKLYF